MPYDSNGNYIGNAGLNYNTPTYTPQNFDFSGGSGGSGTDWATVGTGLSTFGSGLADVIGARGRMEDQQTLANTADTDINQYYKDFKEGKFDARTNQKVLDAFSFGRQDLDINPYLSMQATAMGGIDDPRMMAASLGGMNTSATKSLQGLQQQNRANELANAQGYGQYMGGIQSKNEDFSRGVYGEKLASDKLAYSTAIDNKAKIDQARREGWGNMISGAVDTGMSLYGMGEDGMKIPQYQDGGDVMQQILASQGEGAVPPRQDLPGEESHESNPISMVAPDGEVVGEATGGEIILNGEQTEEIESAVAMVDQAVEAGGEPPMEALMALYEAVSGVLSQPQFQDGQQESSSPEQDNMMAFLEGQQMA